MRSKEGKPTFTQKSALDHNRLSTKEALAAEKSPLILVLENIRSGNNVGSIFRTADSLGLEQLILTGFTAQPPHREILKTSLGAEESVAWQHTEDLSGLLAGFRQNEYCIAALEQTHYSTPLQEFDFGAHKGLVLILGNEVRGVSPDTLALVDEVIEIPQFGAKQSLNVSVATGIVSWAAIQGFRYK